MPATPQQHQMNVDLMGGGAAKGKLRLRVPQSSLNVDMHDTRWVLRAPYDTLWVLRTTLTAATEPHAIARECSRVDGLLIHASCPLAIGSTNRSSKNATCRPLPRAIIPPVEFVAPVSTIVSPSIDAVRWRPANVSASL